ncbi:MAG: hypothetical protein U5N86_09435 [Planctomycetota bacterium]|nr:hypothetical protein [Planctomycetota bacterium]
MPYEHFLPDIVVIAGALFALGITAVWPKRAGFASYSVALLTMFTSCGLALLQVPEGADWGGMLRMRTAFRGFSRSSSPAVPA